MSGIDTRCSRTAAILCGVSLTAITLAVSNSALAQTAPTAPPATTGAVADQTSQVDDIVVSARRREERVQEVPASVTSLSAERLSNAGIDSTRELAQVTPGLNWAQVGVYAQPNIRGIGTSSALIGDEANVSVYIDGVYHSNMPGNVFQLPDVERIEVLKGPQGTLFGRNATGGAISIFTKQPSYTPTGEISAAYSSFNRKELNGYFSTGLTDKLAFSGTLFLTDDDGYVKDVNTGARLASRSAGSGRFKLLYEPTDRISVLFSADYTKGDDNSGLVVAALNGNTQGAQPQYAQYGTIPNQPWKTALSSPYPYNEYHSGGVSLKADVDFGAVQFMSLTAYREDNQRTLSDTDISPAPLSAGLTVSPSKTTTQEFQLSAPQGSAIQWVAGLYAFHNESAYDPLTQVYTGVRTNSYVETDAIAGFGEASFDLTSRLSVTAGLRYSYEEKSTDGQRNGVPVIVDKKASWDDWTPRVVVRYQVPDAFNLYASYSKGFKSGQFNSSNLTGIAVEPETVNAYEIGFKSLWRGPFRFSVAAFQYDYQNIQVQAFDPIRGTGQIQNAAEATINGAEFEGALTLLEGLQATFNVAYTDGVYDRFLGAQVTIPTGAGGNLQVFRDLEGTHIIRTPKWTTSLGLNYAHDLAGGRLAASGNVFWSDSVYWDPANRIQQPSYAVLNARVSWTDPSGRYTATLFGNNLGNEAYAARISDSTLGDAIAYHEPRSVGVKLGYAF